MNTLKLGIKKMLLNLESSELDGDLPSQYKGKTTPPVLQIYERSITREQELDQIIQRFPHILRCSKNHPTTLCYVARSPHTIAWKVFPLISGLCTSTNKPQYPEHQSNQNCFSKSVQ